ncbi:MAG: helix-turn-helix domain-containing protein [Rhodococcus sp. (in: high G+C Gram-positive bacteria)]|uniref:helix-turn-helix domain-containing protein n=1 Tax=Rhodococcus sp. TaxID=1831 RepID=UPI002AD795AD|nr:helix-turn-helix domain-containing protein [Rhodococcus sp. (in: high G+C Gram-positive bacteria)]
MAATEAKGAVATAPRENIDLAWLKKSTAAALTRTEVAEVFGIDKRTVTRGIDDGTIPAIKIGRRVLIPREPLLAMLTQLD